MTITFQRSIIVVSLCLFVLPFFVTAITLAEELNSLERQTVILEAEILRSEQGVPGSLSKQELSSQYQTLQERIQTVTAQVSEAPAVAPSITVIFPPQDQRIEGKAGTSFNILWKTENWSDGTRANIDIIRQVDNVTTRAKTGVPNQNGITNLEGVSINTNATTAKTYKVRVSAANNPSVSAESGWFTIIPPIPLCPPRFDAITGNQPPEKIVIAVEEETAKKYPEWQTRAQEVVDYINVVLAKNTAKSYEIGKFITFPIAQYNILGRNPEFHLDNGYGGTTFFWYVHPIDGLAKEITPDSPVNVMTLDKISEKAFYNIWLVENEVGTLMKSREVLEKESGLEGIFETQMFLPIHELGHSLGLALGEWYLYNFEDKTGILPNLGTYNFREMYPTDPMAGSKNKYYQYSDFNAYIINHNLTHQYSLYDVSRFHAQKTIVRVKDGKGDPVVGAKIKVFGAKKNCFYCIPLTNTTVPLQTILTDARGEAEIENVSANFNMSELSTTGWIAKIIKASYDNRNAGTVTTLVDSQTSCILKGSNTHYIDLMLSGDLTIAPPIPTTPSISVLTPNGGEQWKFGEKQKISWVKSGTIPPGAVIAAYIYKGDQVSALPYSGYAKDDKRTGDMPTNSGYFEWTVPLNSSVPFIRQGGGDYRIKVVMAVDGKIIARDVSNSPFTISASSAGGGGGQHVATPPNQLPTTVLYPNGGENITHGQLAVIQWTSELPDTFNYNLTLLDARGETVIREIDSNRPKGKYAWYVPSDVPPGQYRVRVSGAGALSNDMSNSAFTIAARQIAVSQVTSPRSNQPPVVKSITGPTSVVAGSQNTWTITATDPDGQSVSVSAYSIGADLISGDLFAKSSATKGTEQSFSWSFIFREAGTYPLIVTAKDSEGAVSASTQFLVSAMPSEIKVSIANSPTAPAGVVFPGTEKTLGAFDMTVTGEPVSVDRVAILVEGGSALVHDLYLYDENGVKFEQRVDDTRGPAFPRPKIVFPVGTHTYTVKGTVEATTPFGTAVGIGVHPGSWHNAVGTITGRPATIPTQIILLSIMTVKTPSLGFSASRAGTVRSPTVAPGTKEVPITLYKLDGTALEEDARVSSLPLSYDDYGSNGSGSPQLEACRLSASGEPLMSGANIVAPPVGPFGSVTSVDVSFAFDAPLVVSKGVIKELTLICDVAPAAVGRFSFGVGAGAVSAVGVSSGAPVAISKGISARGAIFTVSSATSFIGSDSLLANILAGLRLLFQQSD